MVMKKVTRYTGKIPKSGSSVFKFGTHMLCHRSIKADKCDLLVNVKDGIILHAYPIGTNRMKIIEDVAKNIGVLDDYAKHPENYELYDLDPKLVKKQKGSEESVIVPISMDIYSDGSCVVPREEPHVENLKKVVSDFHKENEAKPLKKKRSFDMSAKGEW